MTVLGIVLLAIPLVLGVYAYAVYPLILWLWPVRRKPAYEEPAEWPLVTICLPVYNESKVIRGTIESLLALDYPGNRRQILVISDCSNDGTDEIAGQYAARGVQVVRLTERRGKTAAENEAANHALGSIVINTDATTRVRPDGLKALVRPFVDPTVGVASGRDVSVSTEGFEGGVEASPAEARYVGYEMWVRDLETRAGTIVGASGCWFAIRRNLFLYLVPEALSRDFASPLIAREHGHRSVSVPDAICYVPRARSLKVEFRRKTRTMARGLETLWFKRKLMNPFRFGRFAFMLISHKLIRWLGFLTAPLLPLGLAALAVGHAWALIPLLLVVAGAAAGALAYAFSDRRRPPAFLALLAFATMTVVASLMAWMKALANERNPIWEPTRR